MIELNTRGRNAMQGLSIEEVATPANLPESPAVNASPNPETSKGQQEKSAAQLEHEYQRQVLSKLITDIKDLIDKKAQYSAVLSHVITHLPDFALIGVNVSEVTRKASGEAIKSTLNEQESSYDRAINYVAKLIASV